MQEKPELLLLPSTDQNRAAVHIENFTGDEAGV
jgi:hypothetical protein